VSRYHPKIERPITPQQFQELLIKTEFRSPLRDEALVTLLYYTGIRSGEARKLLRSNFWYLDGGYLNIDIGERLKHSAKTDPLFFDISLPGLTALITWINRFSPHEKPFGYSRKTVYRIVKQTGFYPHFFRFNRITQWLKRQPVAVVKGLTGLTLSTLDRYVLKVGIREALKESE